MQAPRALSYDLVDVFAEQPFAGNPLAVVHGTHGMSDAQLQALAREFNLSETAFPTVTDPTSYTLRIFTPVVELPFAGHPSLGAAWSLRSRALVSRSVQQVCSAGTVRLEVGEADDDLVWLSGATPHVGVPVDQDALLAAVGLAAGDLVEGDRRRPLVAGTGLDFCFLQVRSDAVARAEVDLPALRRVRAGRALGGVVVVGWHPQDCRAHVRVFTDDIGASAEDPATGSAALGLGVALVATRVLAPDGLSTYRVQQGGEVGRPSVLHGRVEAAAGQAVRCHVGGRVVPVATGTIRRPPS